MSICKNGFNKMPRILATSPGDIRPYLWTLYWLARLVAREYGVMVELGVRHGDSTRALLAGCEDSGEGLYSFDVEDVGQHVRDVTANLGLSWFDAPWVFVREDSRVAGVKWRDGGMPACDVVFVDSEHGLDVTRAEIQAWAPSVKAGGCLAFHDYWLHDPGRDKWDGHGVKLAVDEWVGDHGEEWELDTYDAIGEGTGFAILWKRGPA